MTDEDRIAAKAILWLIVLAVFAAYIVFVVVRRIYNWIKQRRIEKEQERIGRVFFDD